MSLSQRFMLLLLLFICPLVTVPRSAAAQQTTQSASPMPADAKRPVTVADAIGMTTVGDASYDTGLPLFDGPAQFSPDGKRFLVLLKRGDLETNTNDYSIWLWTADSSGDFEGPEKLLTMSSTNHAAIEQINWDADNQTFLFLGQRPGEQQQLYRFNIFSRVLTKLTDHPTSLIAYSATTNLEQIAYTAEAPPNHEVEKKQNSREGLVVTKQSLDEVLGLHDPAGDPADAELFVVSKGMPARRLSVTGSIPFTDDPSFRPVLSPDGRFIAIMTDVGGTFAGMEAYATQVRPFGAAGFNYRLVDIATGETRSLLDSPSDTWCTAVWLPDGNKLFLSGVFLPLDNVTAEERAIRRATSFTVEVTVSSGEFTIVTGDGNLRLKGFDEATGGLAFFESKPGAYTFDVPVVMVKQGDGWKRLPQEAATKMRPRVFVEEDIRTPPRLFLDDSRHAQKRLLLDLNPSFAQIEMGRVEDIAFTTKDSRKLKAKLFYPIGYDKGKRYPLVIQTHDVLGPEQFYLDGPVASTSGFAAQPLAAEGIMVVQVHDIPVEYINTPEEARQAMMVYEGVIDYLDARKLMDRSRVGIIGFSRTCFYVKFTLTHSTYHFAAAVVEDGFDGGYLQYIQNFSNSEYERVNGGRPFGRGLRSWIRNSPSFKIDRVRTPVRIVAHNPDSVLGEWEWFAALSLMGRPVELVAMRDGLHVLEKPRERLVASGGNLDWFCFWLKGEEAPDPAKAEQYKRWRELRKLDEKDREAAVVSTR